jgi:DHA2 family multidrug resistance protein-like MFS transporter
LGGGLVLGAVGLALMAYAIEAHSLILITLGNTLFAVGSARGTTVVADFVVSSAPEDQSGAASALSETCSEFGGALGIALLGSLATFLYRHTLAAALPAGNPAPATETALRGIGAARAAAETFNGGGCPAGNGEARLHERCSDRSPSERGHHSLDGRPGGDDVQIPGPPVESE